MPTIFINYRVGDIQFVAGALATQLMELFGAEEVFYAPLSIQSGTDFEEGILTGLDECDVMLVIIGPHWLSSGGEKLASPDDWVRKEIEIALRKPGMHVVGVLIDDAARPSASDLPDEIAELARRQYIKLSYRSVTEDVDRLVTRLLSLPACAHLCLTGSETLPSWWGRWLWENPVFHPDVLLAGREASGEELRVAVLGGSSVIRVRSSSVEESLACATAALLSLEGHDVRVVTEPAAWERYAKSKRELVLVPAFDDPDLSDVEHCVVLPCGGPDGDGVCLPSVGRDRVIEVFLSHGLSAEQAVSYAGRIRQDFAELRQDLSRTGRRRTPDAVAAKPHGGDLSDAVVRGPLRHLGLDQVEAEAKSLAKSDPARAAELYGQIVKRLLDEGFDVPALPLQYAHADALRTAGDADAAAAVVLDQYWSQVLAGAQPWPTNHFRDTESVAGGLGRAMAVASRADEVYNGYGWAVFDNLTKAFDALVEGDPHRLDAAVFTCEHALTMRRSDIVEQRLDVLAAMAKVTYRQDSPEERLVVRLGMCLAEVTGDWSELERRARKEFAGWHRPWIRARRARWLVLTNQLAQASASYEEAIESAVVLGMNDEAADWLYGLRVVRGMTGALLVEGDEQHPLAQHLRPSAEPSRLPGSPVTEELALHKLCDGKAREALGGVSRWRWKAYVRAGFAGELDATKQLGKLLAANDEPFAGLQELVRGGARTEAVKVAKALPEESVRWSADSVGPTAREQSAALAVVAECADLLVDEDTAGWVEFAFGVARDPQPQTPFDSLVRQSLAALAGLAPCFSEEQGSRVLDLVASWNLRRSATMLVDIANCHASLAERAIELLLTGMPLSEDYADVALGSKGAPLLRSAADFVFEKLAGMDGHSSVHLALAIIDRPTDEARAYARSLAENVLHQPSRVPGVTPLYGGYHEMPVVAHLLDAGLRDQLATALLRDARDAQDISGNRRNALEGLMLLAPHLDVERKRVLFTELKPFSRGEFDSSTGDEVFTGMRHALSWFRSDFGPTTLADIATRACAAMATADEERAFVRQQVTRLLAAPDDVSVPLLVRSLEAVTSDLRDLPFGHPHPHMHAFAAHLWTLQPDDADLGLALARSEHRFVRATLAAGLDERPEHDGVREVLTNDPRRSVRSLLRRTWGLI